MSRTGPRHVGRTPAPPRLPPWLRVLLYGSTAVLLVSGLLWLVFHHFLVVETDFGARPHPLTYQWLRIHGAAALLSLFALGAMLPVHLQGRWQQERNRRSGLGLLLLFGLLTLTGYLLYYFAQEATRPWISLLHWALGLALPVLLLAHRWLGLRLVALATPAARRPQVRAQKSLFSEPAMDADGGGEVLPAADAVPPAPGGRPSA